MNNLDKLISRLESNIPFSGTLNTKVSGAGVGWHLEHTLLTINGITGVLIKSNPVNYKAKFSLIKNIILIVGKIPRGRAKAPEIVRPKINPDENSLRLHLAETRSKIKQMESLSADKYFTHPYFGDLKLKQAIKFLEIHTKHHLNIIEDILKGKNL